MGLGVSGLGPLVVVRACGAGQEVYTTSGLHSKFLAWALGWTLDGFSVLLYCLLLYVVIGRPPAQSRTLNFARIIL